LIKTFSVGLKHFIQWQERNMNQKGDCRRRG